MSENVQVTQIQMPIKMVVTIVGSVMFGTAAVVGLFFNILGVQAAQSEEIHLLAAKFEVQEDGLKLLRASSKDSFDSGDGATLERILMFQITANKDGVAANSRRIVRLER